MLILGSTLWFELTLSIVGQNTNAYYSIKYLMQLFYELSLYPCLCGLLLARPSSWSPSKFTPMLTACFQVLSPTTSALFLAVVNPSIAFAGWGQTSWLSRLSLPWPWAEVLGYWIVISRCSSWQSATVPLLLFSCVSWEPPRLFSSGQCWLLLILGPLCLGCSFLYEVSSELLAMVRSSTHNAIHTSM